MFVRIVLDTCAIRKHVSNRTPQLDFKLINRKRDKVRLSLSASAFVELTRQLADGDVPFASWQACVPVLKSILDERWPCLPNGKQLAWFTGTHVVEPIESVEDEARYMRACWFHLCDVKPEEIGKCQVVYRVTDGTPKSIRLDRQKLIDLVSGQRQEWIDYVQRIQADLSDRGLTARDADAIVELMRSDFGSDPTDAPAVAAKLDIVLHMTARFIASSLKPTSAYNPESERNRGDTFDLNLLFYIPLPAIIVTGDDRFIRGLRETDAAHLGQVLSIDEFNTCLANDSLAAIVSAFQTPERQFRWQREAAYFRWENRNCRISDDLKDWCDSEPIA